MRESTAAIAIHRVGFALLSAVYTRDESATLIGEITSQLSTDETAALRQRDGALYGARNILALVPATRDCWRRSPLIELLHEILGPDAQLVRGLYFDKPPAATWSLPWHQDRTIAVRDNRLPTTHFTHPTTKAGVPHVEAPRALLEQMLTLRIHLDAAVPENGPLQVLPGSHRLDNPDPSQFQARSILSDVGDVLAMRPLVCHCSGASQPGSILHRRVLHLEFAGVRELPDEYTWHSQY